MATAPARPRTCSVARFRALALRPAEARYRSARTRGGSAVTSTFARFEAVERPVSRDAHRSARHLRRAVDPQNPQTVYANTIDYADYIVVAAAATESGVFKSTDGGIT